MNIINPSIKIFSTLKNIMSNEIYKLPIEHDKYKNFYHVNFANKSLVSKEGNVISVDTGRPILKNIRNDGVFVTIKNNDNYSNISISRLLGIVFLELPSYLGGNYKLSTIKHLDNDLENYLLDNLKWESCSERNIRIWNEKRNNILLKYTVPNYSQERNGWYPNPFECKEIPGYYFIPGFDNRIVITKDGSIFNLLTNKILPVILNHNGYPTFSMRVSNITKTFSVHRTLSKMFIKIPDKYKNITDLEVNHIDGIKVNFCLDNLEWCTRIENHEHSYKIGLRDHTFKPVLRRNILTNEIKYYRSKTDCCLDNNLAMTTLSDYLSSWKSGRITKDWNVFKYDDSKNWVTLKSYEIIENSIDGCINVVAENILTKEIIRDYSIKNICKKLGFSYGTVMTYKIDRNTSFKNWIFYKHEDIQLSIAAMPIYNA